MYISTVHSIILILIMTSLLGTPRRPPRRTGRGGSQG